MSDRKYLHGFDEKERQRLLHQAEILASLVYSKVDFSQCKSVLEIGSGVGAQTLQILKRFPHLQMTCVELSEIQIGSAQENLRNYIASGQVRLVQGSAENLPFEAGSFDGAFVCWLLEHVENPLCVLQEANRVLKPEGSIYIREVFNKVFALFPASTILNSLWEDFNQTQMGMGGDPYVGVKLGSLLAQSSFTEAKTEIVSEILDQREPTALKARLEYWRELFLSGFPDDQAKRKLIQDEFAKLISALNAVFCFGYVAATAKKS